MLKSPWQYRKKAGKKHSKTAVEEANFYGTKLISEI